MVRTLVVAGLAAVAGGVLFWAAVTLGRRLPVHRDKDEGRGGTQRTTTAVISELARWT